MSETKPTTKKATPKHIANKQVILRVANTDVIIGTTYEVIGKKDMDAPLGFQEFNTTKYLIEGIEENRGVTFDEDTKRWDTGFEITSRCNSNMSKDVKDALVNLYNTKIKEPYENYYQVKVDATNHDFWQPYMYKLFTGRKFDTSRPDQLFDLFHALKQGRICEVGEKDPILQRAANYCVRNREKLVSLQEERASDKAEATFTFMTLLKALDPQKDDSLYSILEWMQITNVRDSDEETLKRTVLKQFDNEKLGYDNAKRFLEAYEMTKNPSTKDEMDLFSMLSKLQNKRKLEFKRQQYYLEDTLLGNHLKGAANLAVKNPEIKELIVTAFEKYCQ